MQFEKERGWSFRTVILVKGWGIIVRARRMKKETRDKILFVCTHSFFDTQVYITVTFLLKTLLEEKTVKVELGES